MKAQKTIRFRISTVYTDVDDMDGRWNSSDPEFLYEIRDNSFLVLQESQKEFRGEDCLGTRTINDEFFTQTYDCDLPTSYRFRWRAREDDPSTNDGITSTSGDAVTSIQVNTIPASAIDLNQSNWTTINTYTNTASGDPCGSGRTVTWRVTLQYQVTNSGQQCKDECFDPYVIPTAAEYQCGGVQTNTALNLNIKAREPSDASESSHSTAGISCDIDGSSPEDIWVRTTIPNSSGGVIIQFENEGGCSGTACRTDITYAWYTSSDGTCGGLQYRGCGSVSCFIGCGDGEIKVDGRAGEDIWVRIWEEDDQGFEITINEISPTVPADKCYTALPLQQFGCNYQASSPEAGPYAEPDLGSWTDRAHPDLNPATCADCICQDGDNNSGTGTVWNSNENMVWYTFSHAGGVFNVAVDHMNCSGGANTAQLGVFSNSGTAANPSCDLAAETGYGCSVGVGQVQLSIPMLPAGDYILVIDGNAGAECDWEFFEKIGGDPLPLQMVKFDGNYNDDTKNIDLYWESTEEENFVGFAVERSVDAVAFSQIGFVEGTGSSSGTNNLYAYSDDGYPRVDLLYYRLRLDDNDGSFRYSNVITTTPKLKDIGVSVLYDIYPNPAKDNLSIPFQTVNPDEINAVIYDMSGKLVRTVARGRIYEAGYHILETNIEDLPKGVYILRFTAGNITAMKRFVKY